MPLIDHAPATLVSASTELSAFQAHIRHHPVTPEALVKPQNQSGSLCWADRHAILQRARESLRLAQERQKKYYDRGRHAMKFTSCDWVLLIASLLADHHVVRRVAYNKLLAR